MTPFSKLVHCFRANLSEQLFEKEAGASERAGLRRTMPSWSKYPRPSSPSGSGMSRVQGLSSSWAAMVSSMLASPHGASEVYMWMRMLALILKRPSSSLRSRMSECACASCANFVHSSISSRLNARVARISAWESCRMFPLAEAILF